MAGKIISIGTALPTYSFPQSEILNFMQKAYNDEQDSRKLKVLFHHSGIQKRHSVLPDFGVDKQPSFFKHQQEQPNVENRMHEYIKNAGDLSLRAIHNTLNAVEKKHEEITHLITVTCTGLNAPGLNAEIVKLLNLKDDIFHTSVNFLGCNAAFYALKIADLIVRDNKKAKVLIVCVELCTLHFRPKNNHDNLLSNTLFSDGAASVLITSEENPASGLALQGFYSLLLNKGNDLMGWNINPLSFEMILNAQVPAFIGENVNNIVAKAMQNYNVSQSEVAHWAIHPGGKKILDEIRKQLSFLNGELEYSYEVLRENGNMSSPTILYVLKKFMESPGKKGEKIFSIGFGPGLSIETSLMRYA